MEPVLTLTKSNTRFSATNSIVFAQYFLTAFDIPITGYNQTVAAVLVCILTMGGSSVPEHQVYPMLKMIVAVASSTKWSLRVVNVLTVLKVISLLLCVHNFILHVFTQPSVVVWYPQVLRYSLVSPELRNRLPTSTTCLPAVLRILILLRRR